MVATYKLNADYLDLSVIDSIKSAFLGKDINIIVTEMPKTKTISDDELKQRIQDLDNGLNTVVFRPKEFENFVDGLIEEN